MSNYQLKDTSSRRGITVDSRRYSLGHKIGAAITTAALATILAFSACKNNAADYTNNAGFGRDALPTMNMPVDAGVAADIELPAGVSPVFNDVVPPMPEYPEDEVAPEPEPVPAPELTPAPTPDPIPAIEETPENTILGPMYGQFGFDSPEVSPEFEQAIRTYVRTAIQGNHDAIYVVGLASMESAQDGNYPVLDDDRHNTYRGNTRAESIADIVFNELERLGSNIPVFKRTYSETNIMDDLAANRIGIIGVEYIGDPDLEERLATLLRGHDPNAIYEVNESYAAENLEAEEPVAPATPAPRARRTVRANSAPVAPSPITPATSMGGYTAPDAQVPNTTLPDLAPSVAPEVPEYVPSPTPVVVADPEAPVAVVEPEQETHAPAVIAPEPVTPAPVEPQQEPEAPAVIAPEPAVPTHTHPIIIAPNGAVIHFGTFGDNSPAADYVESGPIHVTPDGHEEPAAIPAPAEPTAEPSLKSAKDSQYVSAAEPMDIYVPSDIAARIADLETTIDQRQQDLAHYIHIIETIDTECGPSGKGNTLCDIADSEDYISNCGDDNNPNTPAYAGAQTVCQEALTDSIMEVDSIERDMQLYNRRLEALERREVGMFVVPEALPFEDYAPADIVTRMAALDRYAADTNARVEDYYSDYSA